MNDQRFFGDERLEENMKHSPVGPDRCRLCRCSAQLPPGLLADASIFVTNSRRVTERAYPTGRIVSRRLRGGRPARSAAEARSCAGMEEEKQNERPPRRSQTYAATFDGIQVAAPLYQANRALTDIQAKVSDSVLKALMIRCAA